MTRLEKIKKAHNAVLAKNRISAEDENFLRLCESNNYVEESSLSFFNISRWQEGEASN